MAPDTRKQQSDHTEAVAAYNRIVESAKLLDVRLTHMEFDIRPAYYLAIQLAESGEGGKPVSHAINQFMSDVSHDPDSGFLAGQIGWDVTAKQSRKNLLKISARYLLTYTKVPAVGEEHCEAFMRKVGTFAVYPYFRNLVSQVSWASGAELPILPILK